MEVVKHETCQQYVARRLSEGWRIVSQRGYHLILSSPDGNILRPVDLRNDVVTIRPNANGNANEFETQWPDTGQHWDKVDEEEQDQNSTYLLTDKDDLVELFNLGACGLSDVTINFVKVYTYSTDYNDNNNRFRIMVRSSATEAFGDQIDRTSWRLNSATWATDPATGSAWTIAAVDGLQAGMKTYSMNGGRRLTQVYVEVDYTSVVAPTVTTQAADLIEATTARLNGQISSDGGEACQYRFRYKKSG
ncbi:unnamed protein product, partial [marine sediment metagenome]